MQGSVFGFAVDSELPLTRLRQGPGTRGTLRFERARESPLERFGELTAWNEPKSGIAGFALARTGTSLVAWCSATGSYLLDPSRGRLSIEPARGTTPAWEHRLLAMVVPILLAERGDLVLHAAAVVVGGRAVLLCGPARRGKSTLALTLAALGNPVLAEDGVVVTLEGDLPVAWPGPRGIRLKDDSAVAFARSLSADDPKPTYWSGATARTRIGAGVALHSLPPGSEAGRPAPLGAVVALGERRDELAVERLTRAEAVPALVQSLFHAGRSDGLRPAYRRAVRLAALIPAFRATLPDDLRRASHASAELCSHGSTPGMGAGKTSFDCVGACR